MAGWFEKLFREHGVFKVPGNARDLPACRIRPYREDDREACTRIYQLNEGGNFRGGLDAFLNTLEHGHSLYLVCEEAGEVRAMGSMNIRNIYGEEFVDFFYGMVHPDHQRRGFGTAMVLARLSVLPPPRDEWRIRMHSVADPFHRKFGFHPVEVVRDDEQNRIVTLLLYVSAMETKRSRALLQAAGIPVECDGCGIPVHTYTVAGGEPAPDDPRPEADSTIVPTRKAAITLVLWTAAAAGVVFWCYKFG
ncbi:MAG: N-acetyltransferase [Verrucomicrobiaceae bacterium]|nr:MAG: N-acetyltransferase [Verrucomicrobiaceae bacterium]